MTVEAHHHQSQSNLPFTDVSQVRNIMELTGNGADSDHNDSGYMIEGAFINGDLSIMSAV